MKIADYIAKHQIKPLVESLTKPVFIPPEAYAQGEKISLPSFLGANANETIYVTTYTADGVFVVYETGKRRITGKLDADVADLG